MEGETPDLCLRTNAEKRPWIFWMFFVLGHTIGNSLQLRSFSLSVIVSVVF